jgi:hypothetical protein
VFHVHILFFIWFLTREKISGINPKGIKFCAYHKGGKRAENLILSLAERQLMLYAAGSSAGYKFQMIQCLQKA